MTSELTQQVDQLCQRLRDALLLEKGGQDHWTGTLAASALSTATAISALALAQRSTPSSDVQAFIDGGLAWLAKHQNEDGGFGDTDRSPSNIATTTLVLAAWKITGWDVQGRDQNQRAWQAFDRLGGWTGLRERYGVDKTFVVPILTNCALAGLVGWDQVAQLPFPAACLPQSWYRFVRLPVVSYAIPALVAIGQARFYHRPTRFPLLGAIYRASIKPSLRTLERMQPKSGGYLEATPLTSFVLMSLASMRLHDHPVAENAVRFLKDSVLSDGSWPIDTNLATWITSLTVSALASTPESHQEQKDSTKTIRWLLSCQQRSRHPFTGADPFGWGWTDLSGAVPDGDDTPAALIALKQWSEATGLAGLEDQSFVQIANEGVEWLLGLQNRDGGWPTFCRGWGKLPFDRSGSDLTAHAMRAISQWMGELEPSRQRRAEKAMARGKSYLERTQRADGSWLPLWFGNHNESDDENPYYGTGKVLISLGECGFQKERMAENGVKFLLSKQNKDGGWGGGCDLTDWLQRSGEPSQNQRSVPITSSVEETSVALEGLVAIGVSPAYSRAIIDAVQYLAEACDSVRMSQGWPIGFYFAKLWYYERLYPSVFAMAAVSRLRNTLRNDQINRKQGDPCLQPSGVP